MTDKNKKREITPAVLGALASGDFYNAAVASEPGGIERQEKAGQVGFVSNELMPTKGDWPALEALGVKRGADVDDLFCRAELPRGWKKSATNHSMWSQLLDADGHLVADIFYKAAFYDRKAEFWIRQQDSAT